MFSLAHYEIQTPRDRYVAALSRVRAAELEYSAYVAEQARAKAEREYAASLAEQERARERARIWQTEVAYIARRAQLEQEQLLQQRRTELRQANALRMRVLQAATLALHANHDPKRNEAPRADTDQDANPEKRTQLGRKQRVRPRRSPSASARDALIRRHASERNIEVHDTIRNLLSRLPEGRAKRGPLTAVKNIERASQVLASEFVFPLQLDFFLSATTSAPALADLPHTPQNAPVRRYARALHGLLVQLDAIESHGDTVVRRERARVVRVVERALKDLETIVEGRWKLQDVQRPSSLNVPPATSNALPEEQPESNTKQTKRSVEETELAKAQPTDIEQSHAVLANQPSKASKETPALSPEQSSTEAEEERSQGRVPV